MKIQITEDDIARGTRQSCYHCPLANVLTKLTNGRFCVVVTPSSASFFIDKKSVYRIYLPLRSEVGSWVRKFDDNQEVSPFEFELDKLEDVISGKLQPTKLTK